MNVKSLNYSMKNLRKPIDGRPVRLLAIGFGLISMAGCGAFNVKPWQHDLMAESAMQLNAYPLEASMDDHIYFSKEGSSGGRTYAGGGCGCN